MEMSVKVNLDTSAAIAQIDELGKQFAASVAAQRAAERQTAPGGSRQKMDSHVKEFREREKEAAKSQQRIEDSYQKAYQQRLRMNRDEAREKERLEAKRIREAERAERDRIRQNIAGERELMRMDREREDRRNARFSYVGTMAGRGLMAGAALTANGFRNTAEGGAFSNQISGISREMANAFKPWMDAATSLMRNIRGGMEEMGPGGQAGLRNAALVGGAAYLFRNQMGPAAGLLYRNALRPGVGMAASGLGRFGAAAGLGRGGIAGGALALAGSAFYMKYKAGQLDESLDDNIDRSEVKQLGYGDMVGMDKASRSAAIDKELTDLRAAQGRLNDKMGGGSTLGKIGAAARMAFNTLNPFSDTPGVSSLVSDQQEINRRNVALSALKTGRVTDDMGKVLDTTTAGYGSVGSTAELVQNASFTDGIGLSDADKAAKPKANDVMTMLINAINDLVTELRDDKPRRAANIAQPAR